MALSRRQALQVTGASISGGFLAGCLSSSDPTGVGEDDPDEDGDADDMSIDGRLHNESGEPQTFMITIRNAAGEEVTSDEWEVGAGETKPVSAVGKPNEPRTFEVTVNGMTETATLEFDVDAEPGKRAGYVEITYTQVGTVEVVFTPVGDGGAGLARVEEPPYEISEPECSGAGDRDPLWLCENMDAEPSVAFDQVETSSMSFADEELASDVENEGNPQFYAALLTDEDDLDRVDENTGGDVDELIGGTDFESEALLVVQTGWGSGSETPHFKRIEETDDGVHAFGCYRRPCGGTGDVTMRTVVARFERPEILNEAIVSLTFDPKYLVNFEAGEGVVTVDGL
ncbi:hypothetical protein [Halalkalicoccus sp. NIPERK01]|uniref:hypothetical protein n=1 Tax=Halalkalicoccus sp. NIPERK01 TaxID=3053469 RepID=UPI00256F085E|nr:hypothetical protein [Halalkalicoccus sp. NIPERK01]MDL5363103.1 hypothetical protein [Halalkalicoccus sp. NIPERK01]